MNAAINQAAISLGMATLMGASIGFERQWRQRMAGLRTNTASSFAKGFTSSASTPLVAIGAASFVILAASKNDAILEQIVGRLSLESTVSAASWSVGPILE